MDSNSFLLSFEIKPEDFERTEGPIPSNDDLVNAERKAGIDAAQTMIDTAYEYWNFYRFRKRSLLMR